MARKGMTNRNHIGFGIITGALLVGMIMLCIPPHNTEVIMGMCPVVILGAILYG